MASLNTQSVPLSDPDNATNALLHTLRISPQDFLQPTLPLYTDTLTYLKHTLDPVATDVSVVQHARRQELRKKRKRNDRSGEEEDVLKLREIHTDVEAFTVEQVWEQARRVIEAVVGETERGLVEVEEVDGLESGGDEDSASSLGEEGVDYEVEGVEVDDEDDDANFEAVDDEDAELDNAVGMEEDLGEGDEMDLDEEDDINGELLVNDEPPEEFVSDKFGLNDGFFSIDSFNRNSEFLEQQDARGENDGAASDEEDVDWDADPLGQNGTLDDNPNDVDSEDEEDGPTFGDPDAPSEDEDAALDEGEMDAMGDMSNTNNIMYADFFAPPAQKKGKKKKGRPNPHNFPAQTANGQNKKSDATADADDDDDMGRTMAAVHRDLFEDEDSASEDDDGEQDDLDPSDPKARRSAHERRKAALAEEIRKLEAANVTKREWTLSGEARAADRPVNSLLEEDLEFERAGKPVPVITAEVSESIEELIKRRILAHDFQDVLRRRPDDLATGKAARRGQLDFVLDDNKSKKGLAEEYEEEHLRRTDPNFVDVKDEKVKKEEGEISALWKKVCADLDGLSSWNFRPKQPAPQLEIRVDAPAIAMEDARPAAGGDVAGASQLAPQELYKAGEGVKGVREEVVGKSGLPEGREEMGRDEKKRRRRREKERIRKANGNVAAESGGRGGQRKKGLVGELKKGGVKVIGRKGEVTDVEGRGIKSNGVDQRGVGRYKL